MNAPSPSALTRAALFLTTTLLVSACQTVGPAPLARRLPPVDSIVPVPLPRPQVRKGDDARVVARRALDFGDGNARGLRQARDNYERLAEEYAR